MNANKKFIISIGILSIIWLVIALIGIFTGTYEIGPIDALLNPDELSKTIFLNIRVPRVLMATLAGGTLAISGAADLANSCHRQRAGGAGER